VLTFPFPVRFVSDGEDDGKPSHWESGFLMVRDDGGVELLNAQQSGRVGVLTGSLHGDEGGYVLRLSSVVHAHDELMRSTTRELTFRTDELGYEVRMATDRVSQVEPHLRARLGRCAPAPRST